MVMSDVAPKPIGPQTAGNSTIRETAIACCIVIFGVFVTYKGIGYGFGTARQLGSGAIPAVLGVACSFLGLVLLRNARQGAPTGHLIGLRSLVSTIAGMALWALLAPRFGLAPATICLVILGSLGQPVVRPVEVAVLAIVMSAAGAVIFIYGLGVPLHVARW
jgi:putative tricarboxylic transport membrane protein